MRLLGWLPLRFILRKAATSQGFLDPIELLARLRALAQPSEVGEPVELLRAGVVFHARGLINSRVIQHNLDWLWPYWVERQYNPLDISFTPRAFAITHINQTHRNWTAIGRPDLDQYPIIDPRGLLTPLLDGWSLDAWLVGKQGKRLLPSRKKEVEQSYGMDSNVSVETVSFGDGLRLRSRCEVVLRDGQPTCELTLQGAEQDGDAAWLVVSLRPYNPEGISFITSIEMEESGNCWRVNNRDMVRFSDRVERHLLSSYPQGDVFQQLGDKGAGPPLTGKGTEKDTGTGNKTGTGTGDKFGNEESDARQVNCAAGLASAAAMFRLDGQRQLKVSIPLDDGPIRQADNRSWDDERQPACRLECPDSQYQYLYEAAVTSLILHSPGDVYPGPYTYKRFWFRDAAFIIHALLCSGLEDRARRAIDEFFSRQTPLGYFRSQEGEWDSNGEVLWILERYRQLTGLEVPESWYQPIEKGGRWIIRKLTDAAASDPHAGLLPAGFSAEHLGPNDYYFWDDFWAVAGLQAGAALLRERNDELSREFAAAATSLQESIDRSLSGCQARLGRPAMPASPYRRLDAGAVGSIAAGYPLQLMNARDDRLVDCVEYLLQNCFVEGAFFQDMIHSGMNAYLTLQTAQVLLRAGDPRYLELLDSVACLASSTGQWPEAIHPQTRGGCMGDGHHVWAAAEWVLMMRSCFVQEEKDCLVLGAGIPPRWIVSMNDGKRLAFGPTLTRFGALSIRVETDDNNRLQVIWVPRWHAAQPKLRVAIPGYRVTRQEENRAILEPLTTAACDGP
ncbi:MAG: hypothetical protein R3F41_17420 [Gammaproteobacteria bacterium]|nr:hypothetical protein [Pseudomonadales bacterium]MCP5347330.1 hypothetical protein [Pseudomonadales bacterium]